MSLLITLILSIVTTEAVVELVVKSEFFSPLRAWFFDRRKNKAYNFIHELLDCGYCFSVWVAFLVSIILVDLSFISGFFGWFIAWMVVHRTSNILHFVIDRIRGLERV
jgi:hypothetical protein